MLLDTMIDGDLIHPEFEAINELQIFDADFDIDCPFTVIKDRNTSFKSVFDDPSI